ncbi:MAG: hypothetical protein ACLUIQ_01780 [Dialister invisus]
MHYEIRGSMLLDSCVSDPVGWVKHDELIGQVYSIIDPTDGDPIYMRGRLRRCRSIRERAAACFQTTDGICGAGNTQFDYPGHRGSLFQKHPAGRIFYNFTARIPFVPISAMQMWLWGSSHS